MKVAIALISILLLAQACSVFGVRTVEEPDYDVLVEDGDIQVREYGSVIVAETVVEASYDESGSIGFDRLGGYIFGNNAEEERLPMTAPVLQEEAEGKWIMTFVMPADHALDTLPDPVDTTVEIKEVPPRKVATIRYSGSLSEEGIEANAERLQAWLKEKGYKTLSPHRSAGYDPPWTIPALRRNEVHIDVE